MADAWKATHKVRVNDEDETHGSGSGSGSGYSDLTGLENETDELGKRILQHQRDARRLDQAVHGDQQAFRQRRARDPIVDVLTRHAERHRGRKVGEVDSEPPVTVPREWGGRRTASWMRKIQEPSEPDLDARYQEKIVEEEVKIIHARRKSHHGNERPRRTLSGGDQPVRSKELRDLPSIVDRSSPSSLRHMNTTILPNVETNDNDFTDLSILASTPAVPRPPRRIDALVAQREHEDEIANRRDAVSTSQGLAGTRKPNVTLRRASNPKTRDRVIGNEVSTLSKPKISAGVANTTASRLPRRTESPGRNKENLPPSEQTANDKKIGHGVTLGTRTAQPLNFRTNHRTGHNRDDSLGLLRKLARVSSMSPGPTRHQPERRSRSSERHGLSDDDKDLNESREQRKHKQSANTQQPPLAGPGHDRGVVRGMVGAQSITPAPPVERRLKTGSNFHSEKAPHYPRSALEGILRGSKDGNTSQQYGESTMQSLENIVSPNLEPSDPTVSLNADDAGKEPQGRLSENQDGPEEFTQAEKDRRQEALAMEAMNKHLQAAQSSIQDANRGLRRVENRIDTAQEIPGGAIPSVPKAIDKSRPSQAPLSHTCETCSGQHRHSSVWLGLWTELRSLFYTWIYPSPVPTLLQPQTWPRPRPTTFGFILLISAIWFVIETSLCWRYCHPLYSAWSEFPYSIDPDAPDFPFVIPTLVFRPLRWLWGPALETVLSSLAVFWSYCSRSERVDTSTSSVWPSKPASFGGGSTKNAHLVHEGQSRAGSAAIQGAKTAFAASYEWISAPVEVARETATRVAQSVVEAVDETGWIWDDLPVFS